MFLSIQDLELRKIQIDTAFAPGQIDFVDDLQQVGPITVTGEAELLNSLDEIRVAGSLRGSLAGECDRCLEPIALSVNCEFDLQYQPERELVPGEEIELDEKEAEVGFYQGAGLELADVVREQVLLSLPLQRVCSESCKGLCALCGQNRNLKDCQCRPVQIDERWAALKSISTGD
jgi:uncharacterized protein